jgi:hypothetical protein
MIEDQLFQYVNEPVVNIKEKPTNRSIIVSQTFFSEKVEIKQILDNFVKIKTTDEYQGWIPFDSIVSRSNTYPSKQNPSIVISRLKAHIYNEKDTIYGPLLTVPYGCKLEVIDQKLDSRWIKIILPDYKEGFIQKGDVTIKEPDVITKKKELIEFSQKFLGLPYTWGGRSSFGFDCSGFVQMLYKQIGISLPRDSKDQAKDKRFESIKIKDLEPSDLIFFGKSNINICHVGMYLFEDKFIHATVSENKPYIRISKLTENYWNGKEKTNCPYRTFRKLIKTAVS